MVVKGISLRIGDILIYTMLILAILFSVAWKYFPKQNSDTLWLCIRTDDDTEIYPLDTDTEIPLTVGAYSYTVIIEHHTARVEEATCPDGLCEKSGTISGSGESIVCLPAHLILTVEGGRPDADAILG